MNGLPLNLGVSVQLVCVATLRLKYGIVSSHGVGWFIIPQVAGEWLVECTFDCGLRRIANRLRSTLEYPRVLYSVEYRTIPHRKLSGTTTIFSELTRGLAVYSIRYCPPFYSVLRTCIIHAFPLTDLVQLQPLVIQANPSVRHSDSEQSEAT